MLSSLYKVQKGLTEAGYLGNALVGLHVFDRINGVRAMIVTAKSFSSIKGSL